MIHLTGELPKTATYSRREYAILAGLDFGDGRDATVIFQHIKAKSRFNTKSWVSRYAVSEVNDVGFMGRVFVWDKELGDDEHGEQRANVPKPPYRVRVDQHGQITCQCMAGNCHAPTCRHCDATLVLIDEGVFSGELAGV